MTEKKPYNTERLCSIRWHAENGELAATCQRCYTSALGQMAQQRSEEQKVEHHKYLDRLEMTYRKVA